MSAQRYRPLRLRHKLVLYRVEHWRRGLVLTFIGPGLLWIRCPVSVRRPPLQFRRRP